MRRATLSAVVLAGFLIPGEAISGPVVYDLATHWSDISNPNGVWSYNYGPGQPISVHQANWFGSAAPQPAWAFGPEGSGVGKVPLWAKSVGADLSGTAPGIDFPIGRVGGHGSDVSATNPDSPASITWTSPLSGHGEVIGGTWLMRKIGREMEWTLLLNGAPITGGLLTSGDPYTSSNTFDFALGFGGASALHFDLEAGDVLTFQINRPIDRDVAEFVGIDLTVAVTPSAAVPEPGSSCLFIAGTLGMLLWAVCCRCRPTFLTASPCSAGPSR